MRRRSSHFVHGTTVVINALTERKGARTALITTKGFRDVLAIGRANRPDIYNLRFKKSGAVAYRASTASKLRSGSTTSAMRSRP